MSDLTEAEESEGYSSSYTNSSGVRMKSNSVSALSNSTNLTRSSDSCEDSFYYIHTAMFNKPRPSAVFEEKNSILNGNTEFSRRQMENVDTYGSILGKVHLELCKYHELGRFLVNDSTIVDYEAAFYHLKHAANLGVTQAAKNVGRIYLQLPHDILADFTIEVSL